MMSRFISSAPLACRNLARWNAGRMNAFKQPLLALHSFFPRIIALGMQIYSHANEACFSSSTRAASGEASDDTNKRAVHLEREKETPRMMPHQR